MYRQPRAPAPPAEFDLSHSGGGVYEDLRPRFRPRVTTVLIAATVAVYVLQQLGNPRLFEYQWALTSEGVREGEWWRIFTGAFLHGGPLHLAANAYFGWFIGGRIERYIGPWRLAALTLVSIVCSGLLVVWAGQNAVGFSGVLYGWLASWLAFHLTSRYPALRLSGPQLRSYLQVLGMNLLISFLPGVSFYGHLGGFASGFVVALVLGLAPERRARTT